MSCAMRYHEIAFYHYLQYVLKIEKYSNTVNRYNEKRCVSTAVSVVAETYLYSYDVIGGVELIMIDYGSPRRYTTEPKTNKITNGLPPMALRSTVIQNQYRNQVSFPGKTKVSFSMSYSGLGSM
jgi:hypothetical protein